MKYYKYETTKDSARLLKREFSEFEEDFILLYEFQSEKKLNQPYFEKSCWVSPVKTEFYFYQFESFLTPSGQLSSSDYEVTKKKFNKLQDFYLWAKLDKENLEIFQLANIYSIEKTKDKIEDLLQKKEIKKQIKAKI